MKTTKANFDNFKKEFLSWVDKFGLKGYETSFFHTELDGASAQVEIDNTGMVAEVSYAKRVPGYIAKYHTPKMCGKHEAVHLLLARLSWIGKCRYINDSEINDEEERLVRVLEKLL